MNDRLRRYKRKQEFRKREERRRRNLLRQCEETPELDPISTLEAQSPTHKDEDGVEDSSPAKEYATQISKKPVEQLRKESPVKRLKRNRGERKINFPEEDSLQQETEKRQKKAFSTIYKDDDDLESNPVTEPFAKKNTLSQADETPRKKNRTKSKGSPNDFLKHESRIRTKLEMDDTQSSSLSTLSALSQSHPQSASVPFQRVSKLTSTGDSRQLKVAYTEKLIQRSTEKCNIATTSQPRGKLSETTIIIDPNDSKRILDPSLKPHQTSKAVKRPPPSDDSSSDDDDDLLLAFRQMKQAQKSANSPLSSPKRNLSSKNYQSLVRKKSPDNTSKDSSPISSRHSATSELESPQSQTSPYNQIGLSKTNASENTSKPLNILNATMARLASRRRKESPQKPTTATKTETDPTSNARCINPTDTTNDQKSSSDSETESFTLRQNNERTDEGTGSQLKPVAICSSKDEKTGPENISSDSETEPYPSNFKREVAHNPIALTRHQASPAKAVQPENQLTKRNEPNLWSDSETEETEEDNRGSKRNRTQSSARKKKSGVMSPNSATKKREGTIPLFKSFSSDDEVDPDLRNMLPKEEGELRKILHPELDSPHFGPFEMAPLTLESKDGKKLEVPAALNRYLIDFQKQGITFLHKCLTSGRGAILGDDMGCGKTVQVLGLLCALLEKSGTALDVVAVHKRRAVIRKNMKTQKLEHENALLEGRVVKSFDNFSGDGWQNELSLSPWYPVLIIVPPTTIKNWTNEFRRFTHIPFTVFVGEKREAAIDKLRNGVAEALIAPRSLFSQAQGFEMLNKVKWKLVVIDEFHEYKNHAGHLSQNLRKLKLTHSSQILAMTGTLMQNTHDELWNLIDLVQTGYLGGLEEFNSSTAKIIKIGRTKSANVEAIKRSDETSQKLIQKLRRIMIERKKEDVLRDQLPTKSEKVVFCELSTIQKEVYKHILTLPDFVLVQNANLPCDCGVNKMFFKKFQRLPPGAERINYYRKNKNQIVTRKKCCYKFPSISGKWEGAEPTIDPDAALWRMLDSHEKGPCDHCPQCCFFPASMKLYQLSNHLALLQAEQTPFSRTIGSPEHKKFMKNLEFAKVALPKSITNKLPCASLIRNAKVMVGKEHFELSGKLKVLDDLLKQYDRENARVLLFSHSTQTLDLIQSYVRTAGFCYERMDGTTAHAKRQEIVDNFNTDGRIFLLLLSTKAMGLGLNLTEANKVIIFDVDWNPSWDEQAQDRAYRIGQKQNVDVVRLISRGTIDELKYLRQLYKVQLKQDTLGHQGAPKAARMFRGVQGDKHRKGELFGTENILKFKDGLFLDDIWRQRGSSQRKKRPHSLDIHETTNISKKLLDIGGDKCEEMMSQSPDFTLLPVCGIDDEAKNDTVIVKQKREDPFDNESAVSTDLQIDAAELNHEDLFRSDRGRAAIEEGEDGFDEEMGGETQNLVAIIDSGKINCSRKRDIATHTDDDDDSSVASSAHDRHNYNSEILNSSSAHDWHLEFNTTTSGKTRHDGTEIQVSPEKTVDDSNCNTPPKPRIRAGKSRLTPSRKRQKVDSDTVSSNIQICGVSSSRMGSIKTTFSSLDFYQPSYTKGRQKNTRRHKR